MATYNLTQRGVVSGAPVYPDTYPHSQMVNDTPVKTVSAVFNGADATVKKGSALATSDVFELLNIPAGAFVLTVTHVVTTAEGGTSTYHIGDGADVDGYVVSGNSNTTTNASSFNATTTPAFGVGKYYAAADTIDLVLATGTAAAAVVKISATYIQTAPLAV